MRLRIPGSDVSFLLALLALSIGLNVFLWWQRKGSAAQLAVRPVMEGVGVGSRVPPMRVTSLHGELATIDFTKATQPTVVYVFSTECGWCDRNVASIKHLASRRKDDYTFVGVARGERAIEAYVSEHELPFPVYAEPTAETRAALGLSGVPLTLVVSPAGRLLARWPGAYVGSTHEAVETFFGLKVPEASASLGGPTASPAQFCRDANGAYSVGALVEHTGRLERCGANGNWEAK